MILKQLLFGSFTLLALSFASCSDTAETKETTTEQEETDAMLLHTSPATPGAAGAQSATMVTPTRRHRTGAERNRGFYPGGKDSRRHESRTWPTRSPLRY